MAYPERFRFLRYLTPFQYFDQKTISAGTLAPELPRRAISLPEVYRSFNQSGGVVKSPYG